MFEGTDTFNIPDVPEFLIKISADGRACLGGNAASPLHAPHLATKHLETFGGISLFWHCRIMAEGENEARLPL